MGFVLNINGEKVWETDERVTRIGVQTSQGEGGAVGIDHTQTAANLIVSFAENDGVPRIEDLDGVQRPRNVTEDEHQERVDALAEVRERSLPDSDDNAQAAALTSTALNERVSDDEVQAGVDAVIEQREAEEAAASPSSGDEAEEVSYTS